jgi:hypothetical protein
MTNNYCFGYGIQFCNVWCKRRVSAKVVGAGGIVVASWCVETFMFRSLNFICWKMAWNCGCVRQIHSFCFQKPGKFEGSHYSFAALRWNLSAAEGPNAKHIYARSDLQHWF